MAKLHPLYAAAKVALLALPFTAPLFASNYDQINLVSNQPGLATYTDPNLVNPWGVANSATGPFWVSDQVTALSTLYNAAGTPLSLVVSVPGGTPPNNGPTGQVFNSTTDFKLGTASTHFLFDTQAGTINAWSGGTTAPVVATSPGANFTGLALANSNGSNYLYAADSNGGIQVFNSTFQSVTSTTFAGKFADPNLPSGYTAFNVQLVGSELFVTYAPATGSGGIVDIYDTAGNLVKRFSSNSALYAPWGIALAPSGFGSFSNDLLIGNFGNGEINAFDPLSGNLLGTLDGENGMPLVNESLWSLEFRNAPGYNPDALYFTAGLADESGGLLGEIAPTPEPPSLILLGTALLSFGFVRLYRFIPAHGA